jgi:hypothetical protein
VDRLSRVNQQLRARVEVLEQVEVAAHRLLSAKPTMERDARERLLAAIKRAEVVAG